MNILYEDFNNNIIPIEVINDVLNLNKTNKKFFESNIILKYQESIEKCVNYILNVTSIRKKLDNNMNIELKNDEMINLLSYKVYNMRCLSIINFIKNNFININLKNNILQKINEMKLKYENMLSNSI